MDEKEIISLILDTLHSYEEGSPEAGVMQNLRDKHNLCIDDLYKAMNWLEEAQIVEPHDY